MQFVDSLNTGNPGLNAVVIPDGPLDRSPCGTGTSARMALLHSRGQLPIGRAYQSKSLLGSRFIGKLLGEAGVAGYRAVRPYITGSAYITAFRTLVLDGRDPFPQGFSALQ